MKIRYRLGLDIGTNSIGWCVYLLEGDDKPRPVRIVRLGSRIFSDGRNPKSLASLAADRRQARQMRRRHDRVLKRQARFMLGLIRFGLMPEDDIERFALSKLDPYELRAKGLDESLTAFEFGRALYHLAKRRGFQSSRKTKSSDEKDAGKIHSAISRTRNAIEQAGCATLGQYLAKHHAERKPVRARLGADGKDYMLYIQRAMVAEEFDKLWAVQCQNHPSACTDEARSYLRDTLLHQRPLLPVEPGRCLFEPDEPRIPMCSPLFQRFRILQELNNLRVREAGQIADRALTLDERNTLLARLARPAAKPITFAELRKTIGLRDARFSHENDEKRAGIKADAAAQLAVALSELWPQLDGLQQEALAVLIENAANDDELRAALNELPQSLDSTRKIIRVYRDNQKRVQPWHDALAHFPRGLTEDEISALLRINLPDDYGSLSSKAIEQIIPHLDATVATYDQAVRAAGYGSHSDQYTGEIFKRLPYYGQCLQGYVSPHPRRHEVAHKPAENEKNGDLEKYFGRIANPTVHVGLNQLRVITNEIIRRWGMPEDIVVELAREFGLSGKRRQELLKEQKENQDRNETLNACLRELGQRENRDNRQRLILWEELGRGDALVRTCLYTGQKLSLTPTPDSACIFSSQVEIDHILPYSRTLDDGLGNKILCVARANRDKSGKTPFEAFSHSPSGYLWDAILDRARALPARKAMRLREAALQDYLIRAKLDAETLAGYGFADSDGFLARHLIDTSYLSRVARQYLTAVCPPNKVWVTTGRLTGELRARWDLNEILDPEHKGKNRDDHRHHAIDAAVIGLCDRALIQRMATAAKYAETRGESRKLKGIDPPWINFHAELAKSVHKIIVSHKLDHSTQGALHNDTNYGKFGDASRNGALRVGKRVPLTSMKNISDIRKIADEHVREDLEKLTDGLTGKEFQTAITEYSLRTGLRRARALERLQVIPIEDRWTKQPYRYVKGDGNYCYDIYRKSGSKWEGKIISTYTANNKHFRPAASTAGEGNPLIMRIRKGDMLKVEHEGRDKIMHVEQISDGKIIMAEHHEANVRARSDADSFSYLQKAPGKLRELMARIVGVDPLGYVNDSGFKE